MIRCKLHPKYLVLRRPRCLCETCWKMWYASLDGVMRLNAQGGVL